MKKLILVLFLLSTASIAFADSVNLLYDPTIQLTDAEPTVTRYVQCNKVQDVYVWVESDKGLSIVITPVLDSQQNILGPPSSAEVIAPGGGSALAAYSYIGSTKAMVVVTKNEAGSTSTFNLYVTGRY